MASASRPLLFELDWREMDILLLEQDTRWSQSPSNPPMSVDPRNTLEKPGTNPNQGMVAKNYIVILVVAVVIALAALLFGMANSHSLGKAGPTTAPTSSGKDSPTAQ